MCRYVRRRHTSPNRAPLPETLCQKPVFDTLYNIVTHLCKETGRNKCQLSSNASSRDVALSPYSKTAITQPDQICFKTNYALFPPPLPATLEVSIHPGFPMLACCIRFLEQEICNHECHIHGARFGVQDKLCITCV